MWHRAPPLSPCQSPVPTVSQGSTSLPSGTILGEVKHTVNGSNVLIHSMHGTAPPHKTYVVLVSRGQTLFRTEGKGLGYGHRATCRPAPWSAYQSQHSIQSHDTWSMWLTRKIQNFSLNRARTWSVRSAQWARSVLRHQLEHSKIEIAGAERSQVLLCHCLHDCHVTSWQSWD